MLWQKQAVTPVRLSNLAGVAGAKASAATAREVVTRLCPPVNENTVPTVVRGPQAQIVKRKLVATASIDQHAN